MFNKELKKRVSDLEDELGVVMKADSDRYQWYERVEDGYLARTAKRLRALEEHIKPKK